MKHIAAIVMLIAAIMVGATSVDAKTTKRSTKATSSQSSSSSQWRGDIPTASLLFNILTENADRQFRSHGYSITVANVDWIDVTWEKPGVCKINYFHGVEAGDEGMTIDVYDSAQCTRLYEDLKQYKVKKNMKYWDLSRRDNTIYLSLDYWN